MGLGWDGFFMNHMSHEAQGTGNEAKMPGSPTALPGWAHSRENIMKTYIPTLAPNAGASAARVPLECEALGS